MASAVRSPVDVVSPISGAPDRTASNWSEEQRPARYPGRRPTGQGDYVSAVECIKAGASDYILSRDPEALDWPSNRAPARGRCSASCSLLGGALEGMSIPPGLTLLD